MTIGKAIGVLQEESCKKRWHVWFLSRCRTHKWVLNGLEIACSDGDILTGDSPSQPPTPMWRLLILPRDCPGRAIHRLTEKRDACVYTHRLTCPLYRRYCSPNLRSK